MVACIRLFMHASFYQCDKENLQSIWNDNSFVKVNRRERDPLEAWILISNVLPYVFLIQTRCDSLSSLRGLCSWAQTHRLKCNKNIKSNEHCVGNQVLILRKWMLEPFLPLTFPQCWSNPKSFIFFYAIVCRYCFILAMAFNVQLISLGCDCNASLLVPSSCSSRNKGTQHLERELKH